MVILVLFVCFRYMGHPELADLVVNEKERRAVKATVIYICLLTLFF